MCALQVSIVAFKKGQLQVLAHAWDRNLGGRNFDEVLFEHFVKEFNAKYKLDITSNARASFRLRLSCEKVQTFKRRCETSSCALRVRLHVPAAAALDNHAREGGSLSKALSLQDIPTSTAWN